MLEVLVSGGTRSHGSSAEAGVLSVRPKVVISMYAKPCPLWPSYTTLESLSFAWLISIHV